MKARSVVFVHTQKPFTIFGLPPVLMILSAIAAVVAFILAFFTIGVAYSVIAMLLTMMVCLVQSIRIAKTDPHVVGLFLRSLLFWRGRPERRLVAGDFSGAAK